MIEKESNSHLLFSLLGIIATLYNKVNLDQIEKQALRDEINHLKSEQGKPIIRPNKPRILIIHQKRSAILLVINKVRDVENETIR